MAIANFNDLKTSIEDWLDRDDLAAVVPDFITFAEARFNREVRTRDMIRRSQATVSITGRFLALPNDYLEMKRIQLTTAPVTTLEQVSAHLLCARFAQTGTGRPKFYAIHEEIEFDRIPDSEYTAEMIYYARVNALSTTNTSNTILTRHPDLYLYASLAAAESYVENDARVALWDRLYERTKNQVNKNHNLGQVTSGTVGTYNMMDTP